MADKPPKPGPLLQTAIDAAHAAERVIRHYYDGEVAVRYKHDETPVTAADVEAEEVIKRTIRERWPGHGFFGEESGQENMDADYLWLIDPIDGTKSFVRRYPFFSTQIALMHQGELIVGVSNAPLFDEMAWAERGQGGYLNGERLAVSEIALLGDAAISAGNLKSLARSARWADYGRLVAQVGRIRGYGDFYHYHLLAAGKIEAVIESDLNILDIAALTVILREAGAVVTDLEQQPIGLSTRSMLASAPAIRPALLAALFDG